MGDMISHRIWLIRFLKVSSNLLMNKSVVSHLKLVIKKSLSFRVRNVINNRMIIMIKNRSSMDEFSKEQRVSVLGVLNGT